MSDLLDIIMCDANDRALQGFAELMEHVCVLYTGGESSTVSEFEGRELAESVLYVLGLTEETAWQTTALLTLDDVIAVWTRRRRELESRIPQAMELWGEAVRIMPPIRNIALRDTLASIGRLAQTYDTFFAAHEVPCSIDYPLSRPVPEYMKGLDYVEVWLAQLLKEAKFLARFDVDEMASYLEEWCPDYRGLLINLYDPICEAWENGVLKIKGGAAAQDFIPLDGNSSR